MKLTLSQYQDAFVAALQGRPAPGLAALTEQAAFAVYRNTVMAGCVEALCANFPSILTLVGRQWMEAAAADYARQAPPGDTRLIHYGAAFADYLEQLQAQHGLPYLAEVARLDACWNEAFSALDEPCLNLAGLAGMTAGDLARSVLRPRGNARWHWCEQHPAYSLWRCGREQLDWADDHPWAGEGVLFVGSPEGVCHQPLEKGGCAFLQACAARQPLEKASQFAQLTQPDLDFTDLLGRLLGAQVFCPLSFA
ncbi:DNA-binding domain-containing protein [Pseudomonas putida]|uniref:HvfC/BufC N-terminal domain-containing protein n=1 Tax=Pseudomonas putida TaxID=303 RepID=UPI0009A1FDB4|nr:DNA-binding domain-containing protein [Pseudomonas putida]